MTEVLLVSPCQGAYGGIEAFVLAVMEALQKERQWEVRVIFKKTRTFTLQPSLQQMLGGTEVELIDRASSALNAAIAQADLVHGQNASPDVIALAKVHRKPIALTIHNYLPEGGGLHRFLWKTGARLADARWYNSQFVWDSWEGPEKRLGSRKVPTVSRLPQGWTPPTQRRGFVFVGRWIANKGIETLLQAYHEARVDRERWPLILIGDGPLRTKIEHDLPTALSGSVRILGFLEEATKNECLQQARWCVVPPETREDFGLTAIEARSLGVPCIITRDGGLPEAGGRHALICEPGDVTGLKELLERAATMGEEEYLERSTSTRNELAQQLEPMSFYGCAYRSLLAGKVPA